MRDSECGADGSRHGIRDPCLDADGFAARNRLETIWMGGSRGKLAPVATPVQHSCHINITSLVPNTMAEVSPRCRAAENTRVRRVAARAGGVRPSKRAGASRDAFLTAPTLRPHHPHAVSRCGPRRRRRRRLRRRVRRGHRFSCASHGPNPAGRPRAASAALGAPGSGPGTGPERPAQNRRGLARLRGRAALQRPRRCTAGGGRQRSGPDSQSRGAGDRKRQEKGRGKVGVRRGCWDSS